MKFRTEITIAVLLVCALLLMSVFAPEEMAVWL